MGGAWQLAGLDEAGLARIAELIALKVQAGDVIALRGDLGAGKTTFARALIRALLADPDAEVASPTFPIVLPYVTPRVRVAHFDLYRLNGPEDLDEVGYDDALATGLAIVEWPERAETALPADRLEITLAAGSDAELRDAAVVAFGTWSARLARLQVIDAFLHRSVVGGARRIAYLQGDASARAYARVLGDTSLVLMDSPPMPDGPPVIGGLPYSRIAHLAEDVRPFVAIGGALAGVGLSAPHLHAADLDHGLLLLEDLGELSFGRALEAGVAQDLMWHGAVDVLLRLRQTPLPALLPLPDGSTYPLPRFDRAALEIELDLLLDWYWPEVKGSPAPRDVRSDFKDLWSPMLDRLLAEPPGLFLRDFHSPNLFWLPDRIAHRQVGVIDFQDALAEPWALDLVSLLQDARVDVPAALEQSARRRYMTAVASREPAFDADAFLATYALFGAQRNTRLIGLWIRLHRRDGKPGYLRHMSRTWDYLARNLEHPSLAQLKAWYGRHFPDDVRRQAIRP